MKLIIICLIIFIILAILGVLLLRKYYIDWCRSFRNKRKSKELQDRMEFLVKFTAVMLLLVIFAATMIVDCLRLKGR